jgi:hypothetical protein
VILALNLSILRGAKVSDPKEITNLQQLLLSRADLKKLGITYSNAHLLRLEASGRFPAGALF